MVLGRRLLLLGVMRIGLSMWNGRVSPVFDVAQRLLVVDAEDGVETGRQEVMLDEASPGERTRRVRALGVEVLICGAISAHMEADLVSAGVRVILHVCGPVDDVLAAYWSGTLTEHAFLMPGCCGRRRRRSHMRARSGRCRSKPQGETS